jgi:hypothetical protein
MFETKVWFRVPRIMLVIYSSMFKYLVLYVVRFMFEQQANLISAQLLHVMYFIQGYNHIVNNETSSNNICKQWVGPSKSYPHNISSLRDRLCIFVISHMYLINYKVQLYGELTLECATTYYKYGCALFDRIQFKTNLLATNLHQGRMRKVHHSLKHQTKKVFSIIHHVL